ncbi:MAG: cadherin-like domain-containing protein [Cyanobacteria bacterium J06641_5]
MGSIGASDLQEIGEDMDLMGSTQYLAGVGQDISSQPLEIDFVAPSIPAVTFTSDDTPLVFDDISDEVAELALAFGATVTAPVNLVDDAIAQTTAESFATPPNDPLFDEQFGLEAIGALEATEILSQLPGSSDPIVVAIVDTGIDFTQPDLAANLATNDLEANGIDGVDDDGNGFVDDIFGFDFVGDNDSDPFDENFHGTAVAGVIGAIADNGLGIAGVADPFNVELLAVRALDADGTGSLNDAAEAIVFAVENGADVINLSLGAGGFTFDLFAALAFAAQNDVLVVAAAGNSGQDSDVTPVFPAAFEFDNIISVAATDEAGRLAGFSNFGATSVDLGAPGVGIVSTVPGDGFGIISGTSFASPLVAGAAAALLASLPETVENPTEVVIDLLFNTVTPASTLQGRTVTGGILDFEAAAQALVDTFVLDSNSISNNAPIALGDSFVLDEDASLTIAPLENDSDADGDTLTISSFTQPSSGTLTDNGDGTLTFTPLANFAGTDSFTYTITDGNGAFATATANLTIQAVNDVPVASDDAFETQAETPLIIAATELLANDSDIDGDTLTIAAVRSVSGGSVAIAPDGGILFTPAAGFAGTAVFEQDITDGNGGTTTAEVTVDVIAELVAIDELAPSIPASAPAATSEPVTVFSTGFDGGVDDSLFAAVGNAIVSADRFPDGDDVLFFIGGARGDASRFATTQGVDVADGGTVEFDLIFSNGGNGGDNAELGEDVALEYSLDGGQTFEQLAVFDTEAFANLTRISVDITGAAQSASTQFRFLQLNHSGSVFDNFAIDNIEITAF